MTSSYEVVLCWHDFAKVYNFFKNSPTLVKKKIHDKKKSNYCLVGLRAYINNFLHEKHLNLNKI